MSGVFCCKTTEATKYYIQNIMDYKHLSWSGTAALLFLCLFLIVNTDAKLNEVTTSNTVTFTGQGKVLASPDVAVINLSIVTESASSKNAQDLNTTKSNAVVSFLKDQGVADKDIKTTSYNIYPQYRYPQYEQPQISGYQVNQTIEAKIRDLGAVSKTIDGVVGAGANQVNSLNFTIENPEALQAQAREIAIKKAKEKASVLRGQIGINLGRIINFSEITGGYTPYPTYDRAMGMGGGGGPSLPAGENEIIVDVSLTYQIR